MSIEVQPNSYVIARSDRRERRGNLNHCHYEQRSSRTGSARCKIFSPWFYQRSILIPNIIASPVSP